MDVLFRNRPGFGKDRIFMRGRSWKLRMDIKCKFPFRFECFYFFCLLELSKEKYHSEYEKFPFSVLFFDVLQFFTWGAWFATLGLCLGSNQFGDFTEVPMDPLHLGQ